MEDNNQLPSEQLDSDKELEQQDKQEQKEQKKEENKKTLKTVVISVICTLLFIIILLLLVILGLKKCANNVVSSSSSNENTYVEIYDNKKLNNVFKEIVKKQRKIDANEDIVIKDIILVTYSLNEDKFNLTITASTDEYVFFYEATNCGYKDNVTGYDNLITYLLSNDEDQNLILVGDGNITLEREVMTTEAVNIDKANPHFITSKSDSNIKHISGYYYQDSSQFYVYNRIEYVDINNPLGNEVGTLIDSESLLYGYYLRLSEKYTA